ncbi:RICIN domain-containing protein [Streptomyces sp. NPDC003233]
MVRSNSPNSPASNAKVQLWGCFNDSTNHPNQWWQYGPTGEYSTLPSLWGGGAKVLDVNNAGSSAGWDWDKIQIWRYLGGSNQFWHQ